MSRAAVLQLLSVLFVLLVLPLPAAGQAVIALHAASPSKSPCLLGSPIAQDIPCSSYETDWPVESGAYVYLVVGWADSAAGIGSMVCGINYCAAPGTGADVLQWVGCETLEFPVDGPNGAWPAAGSVNQVYWGECQRNVIAPDHAHALAGAFYVYAYDSDMFRVTRGDTPLAQPVPSVTDCSGYVQELIGCWNAVVAFHGADPVVGYNPCAHWDFPPPYFISPLALDFGDVSVGASRTRQIDFEPCFDSTFDVTIDGEGFSIVSGGGTQSLSRGQTLSVLVKFEPTVEGPASGTLYLPGGDRTADLTGLAVGGTPVERASWGRIKRLYGS